MPPSVLSSGSTPRPHGKSVHYEPLPPPPPHFPLPPPFNERMIGFGLPQLSVPSGYLGPRKVEWSQEQADADLADLAARLQADADASVAVAEYDLSRVRLSGGGMRTACLVWKTPVRRAALRALDLSHTQTDDAAARVLSQFVAQAPSAVAPLSLERLSLDENGVWPVGFAAVIGAFANNQHASCESLSWVNSHVGALPTHVQPAESKQPEHDASPAALTIVTSPLAPIIVANVALFALHSSFAELHFTPLVKFLSADHVGLRVLNLTQNALSDLFVAYLGEGVRSSTTLEELTLDHNDLSCVGASLLAVALGGCRREEEATEIAEEAAAAAALAAAQAEEDARATGRSTSRQGHAKPAVKPAAASKAAPSKKGKEVEEEAIPEPPPTTQPMPVFTTTTTNSSLKHLSLRANRIGLAGLQAIESMVRWHPALLRCDLAEQRLVPSADVTKHAALCTAISAQATHNAYAPQRELKAALAIGFHPRVGVHSSLRALVDTAACMASGDLTYVPSYAHTSLAGTRASSRAGERTVTHSRTSSRVPIPVLPLTAPSTASSLVHREQVESSASISATPSPTTTTVTATASPTALLLHQALEQVWQFAADPGLLAAGVIFEQ